MDQRTGLGGKVPKNKMRASSGIKGAQGWRSIAGSAVFMATKKMKKTLFDHLFSEKKVDYCNFY